MLEQSFAPAVWKGVAVSSVNEHELRAHLQPIEKNDGALGFEPHPIAGQFTSGGLVIVSQPYQSDENRVPDIPTESFASSFFRPFAGSYL